MKPHIVMISPALANANNGNWQTASRWANFLRQRHAVTILPSNDPETWSSIDKPDLLVALHARRSAAAMEALRERYPDVPSIVVLTGTDLYRDIHVDTSAQLNLQHAGRLVVLQEAGLQELAPAWREKACVIHQSAPSLKPIGAACKSRMPRFEVCMIGHLRAEKDPATFMQAAALLTSPGIRLTHIGGALDAELAAMAEATAAAHSHYRWLGSLAHDDVLHHLRRCHLMVLTSRMEGGANVIIEALMCGVPVLASNISGNRGMLGEDYEGYFAVGDSAALAQAIARAAADSVFYKRLAEQCQARAFLFTPEREEAAVQQLVDNMLNSKSTNRNPFP
ncbi:putative glycosyltransferase (TIGR04348 family) [Paucimonas lemoignei]|uniref:Putative glycosyltransferase (TIGR04348 family) n=1 Tax=Paucimonas lemoignei TaxID=29443 RepID=A0A4R3HTR8_PAULE|nr:selenoneine biosynthesis selenosugar synthase SenB [Paucimonas lemoignei]TCS34756.1 putative glycosyltransferase (TIGR04348 family) [Paucimonas lemoignei]